MTNRVSSMIRSLPKAWPRLVSLYQQQLNSDGIYPLLKPSQQEHFNNTWTLTSSAGSSSSSSRPPPQAAVLVILCSVNDEPSILFTRRSSTMSSHASEISFPGGHYDPIQDNDSLLNTALREAVEELQPLDNDPSNWFESEMNVYGQTTPIPSLKGTPVTPYLALWPTTTPHGSDLRTPVTNLLPGDPTEVDLVFHVTLQALMERETRHELPENRFGVVKAPMFPTPQGDIWGLTAYILRPLLHRLWKPAFLVEPNDDDDNNSDIPTTQKHARGG